MSILRLFKTTFINKVVLLFVLSTISVGLVNAQVTHLETYTEGQGGIEGISYPVNMITDSSGKELFIVAENCLTHLRKEGTGNSYAFVETIKYSSDLYNGLLNADEVKSAYNCRYLYVTGDNQLMIFSFDATNDSLKYLESIKNDPSLTIGYATSSCITVSPDSRNLYLATSWGTENVLHTFRINQTSGSLGYSGPVTADWINWSYFNAVTCSPSNQYLYTISAEIGTGNASLSVFKRENEFGSLEFLQTLSFNDSIDKAYRMVVSPDSKNLYVCDNRSIRQFGVNPDGNLSYIDKLNIPAGFDLQWYATSILISKDNHYLYVSGREDLTVCEINKMTGKPGFIQFITGGIPDNTGFDDIKSIYFSNHDSLIYAVNKYNHTIHLFGRDPSTGKINLITKLVDQDDKIFGLSGASDLVTTNDNKTVVTLTPSGLNSLAIFDRLSNGALHFRRNIEWSELGPAIGAPWSFKITPDDKFLYISSTNMYGIRLLKRDAASMDYTYSKSYTFTETGMNPGERIVESVITSDIKNLYAATSANIVKYSINETNGELTFRSLYKIQDNASNGLKGIISVDVSDDNKYIYTCSNSFFSPGGITVYSRNLSDGSLTFVQAIKIPNVYKILVSHDKKNVYVLGDEIYTYSVDASAGSLELINKMSIADLGFSGVYKLDDGLISNDDKAIIGITKQGKSILSFYRKQETGVLLFKEIRTYSADGDYSSDGPKIEMAQDSKNVYIISPFDKTLISYTANVPLGLAGVLDMCEEDTAVISMDEGYNYIWSDGSNSSQVKIVSPGIYSVYAKDSIGREGWDSINVVLHNLPGAELILETNISGTDTSWNLKARSNGNEWTYKYLWNDGFEGYSKYFDDSDEFLNKEFNVLVTDEWGCKSSDTISFDSTSYNDIRKITDRNKIFIYPNPVTDKLVIFFLKTLNNNSTLEIYDSKGILVFNSIVERKASIFKLDISSFSSGIYFMKLSENRGNIYKIIKL